MAELSSAVLAEEEADVYKRQVVGSVVIGLIASLVITAAGFFGLHALLQLLDTPCLLYTSRCV